MTIKPFLTISNSKGEEVSFERGNITGFKFDGIEVGVTPTFLYKLLILKSQEALDTLTRTSTTNLTSHGK